MGAWGEGIFENDSAADWLDRLATSGKSNAIEKALSFAIRARPGRLEADEASEALAAVEVVAAARGYRHSDLPDEVKEWLATSGYVPPVETVALAVRAAERVCDDSELKELWAEGDGIAAWKRGVGNVLVRLAKPARPPKPRKAAPTKLASPPKPSPRNAVAALKKNRLYFFTKKGSQTPEWCKGCGGPGEKNPLCDADMVHFRQLLDLEELSLNRYAITDEGLRCLTGMTRLRKLELMQMPITDASATVFEGMKAVTDLDLSGTAIGNAVLEQVGKMTKLRLLTLNKDLPLGRPPGFGIALTDAGLKHLQGSRSLEMISLEGTRITDAGFRWLAGIPSLKRITLGETAVTGAGLSLLKKLPRLTDLTLSETAVNDAACKVLASFQNLDWLILRGTRVTGAGLRNLVVLRKLSRLDLSKTSLTDDDVPALLEFPATTSIQVSKTRITAKGRKQIQAAGRVKIQT